MGRVLELECRDWNPVMLKGDANDDIEVDFGYVSVHTGCFAVQMKEFLGGVDP